ncbi:SGNH/GDSL hydrolase family protein [Streptomonospora wellingtoniae]|uniref:SGNH/GDSL hydrolase family protein n=1 Tax=Streptomonospora wellingtoniae TaxID=3075544 RepID=A0ABU2KMS2_9ACTN|nr:SGNH/GDSL hydrolase family protein [Streptomonospora sp. DSM 45055]MDT0300555.1 SGNH/GDSL hydrolase family protein [Streptomonospora sp. DSM 45055]
MSAVRAARRGAPAARVLAPACVLVLTATATAAPAPAAAADGGAQGTAAEYVALGDSFTSGPFIPPQYGEPALCLRSRSNYPNRVAEALGAAEFTDASCIGAETEDMTEPQNLALVSNPPQLDALTADTTLVTLGVGGNDLGYAEVALKCLALAPTDLGGDPCRDHYTGPGGDELRDRLPEVGERIGGVLEGVRERSPDAEVAVVGYPELLPRHETCLQAPFADGDVEYLYGIWSELNTVIAKAAADAGAVYVDTAGPGHDMCAAPGDRWVEGIFPNRPAAPVHPNSAGMAAVGQRVLEALGAEEVQKGSPRL